MFFCVRVYCLCGWLGALLFFLWSHMLVVVVVVVVCLPPVTVAVAAIHWRVSDVISCRDSFDFCVSK